MMTDSRPSRPSPFTLSFSAEGACVRPVEEVLLDLSEELRLLLGPCEGLDHPEVVSRLEQLEHPSGEFPPHLADEVNAAIDDLSGHDFCYCAQDLWVEQKGEFDALCSELEEHLGDVRWAVRRAGRDGEHFEDIQSYALDFETITSRVPGYDGFDEVELSWDGEMITASFSSWGSGRVALTLQPLTPEQEELASFWESTAYDRGIASRVLSHQMGLLRIAHGLAEIFDLPSSQAYFTMDEIVPALESLPWDTLSEDHLEVLRGLAPGWEGDLPALLAAPSLLLPA